MKNDQLFNLMFDVFIFFSPMSQQSGMCFFYKHQANGACAGVCTCNCTPQMDKTVLPYYFT